MTELADAYYIMSNDDMLKFKQKASTMDQEKNDAVEDNSSERIPNEYVDVKYQRKNNNNNEYLVYHLHTSVTNECD
ncbi:hypothetical protein BDA99DRAFT_21701 [Phascolomyces articulosus]|uniref:Uncharacterized protein n=1 Tax=Phascolomyces articulosus TaxID=60185 RepID=A0AAD5K2A0_9FUNG|nr:hypothetical protein BDA99DRAFT_21701 [Phascolomyces articulosus]